VIKELKEKEKADARLRVGTKNRGIECCGTNKPLTNVSRKRKNSLNVDLEINERRDENEKRNGKPNL